MNSQHISTRKPMMESATMHTHFSLPVRPGFYPLVSKIIAPTETVPFVVQPLLHTNSAELYGYEALYRGPWPTQSLGWLEVDLTLLRYLSKSTVEAPLFVNLSNETILTIDEEILFAAGANNQIYFEWSEAVADDKEFQKIVERINRWSLAGLRFVIDDFGTGRDGLERMFAVEGISVVKIDAGMFRTASGNSMARRMLENLITECSAKDIVTVAEGIETSCDLTLAKSMGCHCVQGYFINDVYAADQQQVA